MGIIKDTGEAVDKISNSKVYKDTLQPAAKEIGLSLLTIAKTVNLALKPIAGLVWGWNQIETFVIPKLAEKLSAIPASRIATPSPIIAGPIIEALRFAGHNEDLREMYANLLANSMDTETAKNAHPGYVNILQNICPDEAKIIKLFISRDRFPLLDLHAIRSEAGEFEVIMHNHSDLGDRAACEHPELTINYIDNLCRLGLLEIPSGISIANEKIYDELKATKIIKYAADHLTATDVKVEYQKKILLLTAFGQQFILACVLDKNIATPTSS